MAALLICFRYNERQITAKFQSLKRRILIEDTKGFLSPEKFRDVRETCPAAARFSKVPKTFRA